LAEQTLLGLSSGQAASAAVLRFELGALSILGHLPSLDMCVECGERVLTTDRVAFGILAGGVLCPSCRAGKRQVVSVHGETISSMAKLADLNSQSWTNLEMNARTRGELRGLMNNYLAHLLGHRPKMHEYLSV